MSIESQYIFNDGEMKSRLVRRGQNWFVAEWKACVDESGQWMPWMCGTAAFLALTDRDIAWAR